MAAFVHSGLGGDLGRLLPEIQGALDLPGDDGRMLLGTLVWDGTPVSTAASAIERVYPSPGYWAIARASGSVWEEDLRLLEVLGLGYELFEFPPGDTAWRLDERGGALMREPAAEGLKWPGKLPFPEWLETVDLDELLQQYRSAMIPVNGGDQWLVVDGPDEEN